MADFNHGDFTEEAFKDTEEGRRQRHALRTNARAEIPRYAQAITDKAVPFLRRHMEARGCTALAVLESLRGANLSPVYVVMLLCGVSEIEEAKTNV